MKKYTIVFVDGTFLPKEIEAELVEFEEGSYMFYTDGELVFIVPMSNVQYIKIEPIEPTDLTS